MILLIWISLAILTVVFSTVLIKDVYQHKAELEDSSWLKTGLIGSVVNFFDVLGIGFYCQIPTAGYVALGGDCSDFVYRRSDVAGWNAEWMISGVLSYFYLLDMVTKNPSYPQPIFAYPAPCRYFN